MNNTIIEPDYSIYKFALDQAKTAIAILNREGKYIYVNSSWEKIIGQKAENVYGKDVDVIVPDTSAKIAMERCSPIVAHSINRNGGDPIYTTYTPLIRDNQLIGCLIQTIFSQYEEAIAFTHAFGKMINERNFYKQELHRLRSAKYSIDNIVGQSAGIIKLKEQIKHAALSVSNVLVEGETGTGKELVAHALHDLSPRALEAFVKVNCAAIPTQLAESELFGYEYGAFTGARKGGQLGKFELANKGSLFLDEINHLSTIVQPKLLRVLQEQEIEHIGSGKSIPINVRLIAATNVPLEELIEKQSFRSDLYYRLNVIKISLPPLRNRVEDIPMVAENIIEKLNIQLGTHITGMGEETIRNMQNYDWPGNIRELQNAIERAMNFRLQGTLVWSDFSDLPMWSAKRSEKSNGIKGRFLDVKDEAEKTMIKEMLNACNGNKKLTAESLGISRTMLYNKLKKYNISTSANRT